MTHLNIATFWTIFLPMALAMIGAIGSWATNVLAGKLKFDKGSQALDDFDQAMAHGVALLEDTLQSIAAHNNVISIPAALASAAELVLTLAPGATSVLGITPQSVAALITAKLSPAAAAVLSGPAMPNATAANPAK
jgi:hypothetical protein